MTKEEKKKLKSHKARCQICKSKQLADIEMDYLHCIPWSQIKSRYNVNTNMSIMKHAEAFGLDKKRDRKQFYWNLIDNVKYDKISVDNAIEASKQLDRIERVIQDNPVPSNIQVVYSFAELSKKKEGEDEKEEKEDDSSTGVPKGSRKLSSYEGVETSSSEQGFLEEGEDGQQR